MPTRKNRDGEAIEFARTQTVVKTLRRIRRDVELAGFLISRLEQVYGLETQLGPEWVGVLRWSEGAAVIIHQPFGDKAIEEAKQFCDWWYPTPNTAYQNAGFAVNFVGPQKVVTAIRAFLIARERQ